MPAMIEKQQNHLGTFMTKKGGTTTSEEPLVWESVKVTIFTRKLLAQLSNARNLLEGIDSVSVIHEQICGIEKLLKACNTLSEDYSSRQIDYQTFITNLRDRLTSPLLDEMKHLGCTDIANPSKALTRGTAPNQVEKRPEMEEDLGRVVERLLSPIRFDAFALHDALIDLDPFHRQRQK